MNSNSFTINEVAAKGFQVAADAYERGRPDYPTTAVQRLVRELDLGLGKTVIDLGAGTGKLTRLLVTETKARVIAVEPVEGMRRKLASLLPEVAAQEGTAERIPFPDASVDAVIAAQAFHWFDGANALQEIHRVLKPGGSLGLIWNARDESKSWVAELTKIIDPYEAGAPRYKSGDWKSAFMTTKLFHPLAQAEYRYNQACTHETVVDRIASISFVSALPDHERQHVLDKVRHLLISNPETQNRDQIDFPYRTDTFWCSKK